MKNKNTINKEATKKILDYMTWSSPMNQVFMIEALAYSDIKFEYRQGETNVDKIKQAIKLFGPKKILTSLWSYASEVNDSEEHLRESMKNHFINVDAWLKCAEEALDIEVDFPITSTSTVACA